MSDEGGGRAPSAGYPPRTHAAWDWARGKPLGRVGGAGGIKFNTMVPLTKLGDNPGDVIYRICHEYRMHNCEVVFREDARSAQHPALPP